MLLDGHQHRIDLVMGSYNWPPHTIEMVMRASDRSVLVIWIEHSSPSS